jgi:hypothetical protein
MHIFRPARQLIALLVFVATASAEVCPNPKVPKAEREAADQLLSLSDTEQAEAIQTLSRSAPRHVPSFSRSASTSCATTP